MTVRRFRVELAKVIWATIEVELDEDRIDDDATADEVRYLAIEVAQERAPRLCAQCCGWGSDHVSVSDDDDWNGVSDLHENLRAVVTELKPKAVED